MSEVLWERKPHTGAKHDILRRHLNAWFPILTRWNERVGFIDGFAGPGEYLGGEPGSPAIALKAAISHASDCRTRNCSSSSSSLFEPGMSISTAC